MKKWKKVFCAILILVICFSAAFLSYSTKAQAATTINYSPNPNVEYNYSSGVSVGTIRYISQITTQSYFNWNYWPTNSFGGYISPGSECGTASISMSLSYIGMNITPKFILEANNGYTSFGSNWGGAQAKSCLYTNLKTAFENYLTGNGKYSPPIIHLNNYGIM